MTATRLLAGSRAPSTGVQWPWITVWLAPLVCFACGGGSGSVSPAAPQDCSTVSSLNWVGSCGTIRMIVRQLGVKPLTFTFDNPSTPPGDYTVRIDNLGPGEETVHCEVRLTRS